jgi:hypothetical protein
MRKKYSATKKYYSIFAALLKGELSEWLKEHAWKVCILERVSRVRIPHSPPSPAEALAQAGFFIGWPDDFGRASADEVRRSIARRSFSEGE